MPGYVGFSGHHWLLRFGLTNAHEAEYEGGDSVGFPPSRSGFLLCCLLADDDMSGGRGDTTRS